MCRAFLTWQDLPTVADMSIDTQLKVTSCYRLICAVYSNATVHVCGSVSYRSVKPSLEVSCSPTEQAPINPVQCSGLIGVYPKA